MEQELQRSCSSCFCVVYSYLGRIVLEEQLEENRTGE